MRVRTIASRLDPASIALCRRRLMQDIRDIVDKPYPNITYHVHDDDLTSGCLVLYPEGHSPLHITVTFTDTYPIDPPKMRMDSALVHPNVFCSYICATILRKTDEYTPAYTFKAIAIQMLSFFGSQTVEQEHGDREIDLATFKVRHANRPQVPGSERFSCSLCGFDWRFRPVVPGAESLARSVKPKRLRRHKGKSAASAVAIPEPPSWSTAKAPIDRLPDELLLQILDKIGDFEHLTSLAKAWPRVSQLIRDFDLVRQRELQCFCLKQTYKQVQLGVGVSITSGRIESEFDLLSEPAHRQLQVEASVHNIPFSYWLPLPISWKHWQRARDHLDETLRSMQGAIRGAENAPPVTVLYHFMSDIVVRLNEVADIHTRRRSEENSKSTLRHASEKAIESYFHLFHVLVCMACEDPSIVTAANELLTGFAQGKRSKTDCPNLGHLLVALLVSHVQVTEELYKAIITEAITRNVVWLLDRKGANMPQLSFLESDAVSEYRLQKTFQGSLTSYRLLMFSELFRKIARPPPPQPGAKPKPLTEVRDELFDRHGGPPHGAATHLASEVRRLHAIDNFPAFLREMGLRHMPSAENFTRVLRQTVVESMQKKGYSRWALSQKQALQIRKCFEPSVGVGDEKLRRWAVENHDRSHGTRRRLADVPTFFPQRRG